MRHATYSFVVLSFTSGCAISMTDRELARHHANLDISDGQLIVMDVGMPHRAAWSQTYYDLLKEKYGIQHDKPDPVSFNRNDTYRKAYNEVVVAEIHERFGDQIFVDAHEDARAAWESKNGPEMWRVPDEPSDAAKDRVAP